MFVLKVSSTLWWSHQCTKHQIHLEFIAAWTFIQDFIFIPLWVCQHHSKQRKMWGKKRKRKKRNGGKPEAISKIIFPWHYYNPTQTVLIWFRSYIHWNLFIIKIWMHSALLMYSVTLSLPLLIKILFFINLLHVSVVTIIINTHYG